MRYADEHTQKQFELLQRKGGRPPNSPGWGMAGRVQDRRIYLGAQPG